MKDVNELTKGLVSDRMQKYFEEKRVTLGEMKTVVLSNNTRMFQMLSLMERLVQAAERTKNPLVLSMGLSRLREMLKDLQTEIGVTTTVAMLLHEPPPEEFTKELGGKQMDLVMEAFAHMGIGLETVMEQVLGDPEMLAQLRKELGERSVYNQMQKGKEQ